MEEPTKTTFGKVLRAERKRLELTQEELAVRAGTKQQNIGGWESGRAIPKQDAYDKLLEVFGKSSPLALLPPRGEIVLAARVSSASKASGALTQYSQVVNDWNSVPPIPPNADISLALLQELPKELKSFIERPITQGSKTYRPDYLSPKYCVEIKRITGNRMELSARTGMQQLMVYRAVLARGDWDMPEFVLILVLDQLAALGSKSLTRITDEAELLGIEVRYCNHPNAAAMTIEGMENGTSVDIDSFTHEDDS